MALQAAAGDLLDLARVGHLHRAAQPPGQQRGVERGGAGLGLAAEAAANVLADHAHLALRQLQPVGDQAARAEYMLGALVDRQGLALPVRDRAVRLQAAMHLAGRAVGSLHGHVGLGEARRAVAALDQVRAALEDVAAGLHEWRARQRRRLDRGDVGQRLVLGHDQRRRILGHVRVARGNHRHDLASVAQLVAKAPRQAAAQRRGAALP